MTKLPDAVWLRSVRFFINCIAAELMILKQTKCINVMQLLQINYCKMKQEDKIRRKSRCSVADRHVMRFCPIAIPKN